jgi:hypothetical protein
MLKIVILRQMETRRERRLHHWCWSGVHGRELKEFVSRNEGNFCRQVRSSCSWEIKAIASEGAELSYFFIYNRQKTYRNKNSMKGVAPFPQKTLLIFEYVSIFRRNNRHGQNGNE